MPLYLIFCELQLLHESRILPVPTSSFPSDILGTPSEIRKTGY